MAEKKINIIRKKKIVSGHSHHGGAWKVAYADFVTAMMAFFLVMWLMGSDEETKAAISHYFNHPDTPYKAGRDPSSEVARPMGEKSGDGDTLLKGMDGLNPDDLVPNPIRPHYTVEQYKEMGELITEVMDSQIFGLEIEVESLRFSIPESVLFIKDTSKFKDSAKVYLDKLRRVLSSYKGNISIESHTDQSFLDGYKMDSVYEASVIKAVAVMNYFVKNKWIPQDRLHPVGKGNDEKFTNATGPAATNKNRRIEFILKQYEKY